MGVSKKITAYPYPLNLLQALCPGSEREPPPNLLASIEAQLDTLTERERQALHLRYRDGRTFSKISEELGFSFECTRQCVAKGIRKLRHPSRLRRIKAGVASSADDASKL